MNNINKISLLEKLSHEMQQVIKQQEINTTIDNQRSDGSYAAMRTQYQKEREYWNQGGPVMDHTLAVDVPFENTTISTKVYYPKHKEYASCLFYIHGGGFIVGNLDTHDRIMRIMAEESQCTVIGINYSLSPEAKFPQAILECIAATDYFRQHADQFKIDTSSIGYVGDSAGAHIAMATFLWLRDHRQDTSFIKALVLYYGLYGLKDSRSIRLYGNALDGLTEEDLQLYQEMYLQQPQDNQSPYYCFFNNDLTQQMPACFIASSEFDPLLDDSETLYAILKDKNVDCEYKMYPGVLHGFLHYSKMMASSKRAITDGAHYFRAHIK
ncbi:acetyl esterase [Budvicia diplopodorum]|uniref:acetyl esterase n=1 Tax=Budvicia diplopodorum TaxID=1119056 RepID=UPI00135C1E9E|nr:acetyl esterase [Budvicia diplopodorum]